MIELDQAYIDRLIPPRRAESDKNDYGRVLCVCGCVGYTGCLLYTSDAADE